MENKNLITLSSEDLSLMYQSDFSKKDAERVGQELVNNLLEAGEIDEFKVWSNIVRLKEVVNSADKAFRSLIDVKSKQSSNGVNFEPKKGAKKLNYEEDDVWVELSEKLKARTDLLKLAESSKDVIFDSDGVEVPKVGHTYDKSSITVKF